MLEAGIIHTQETCLRLALIQDSCFGRTRRVVRGVIAMIPVLIGYFVGFDRLGGILLLVLGVMIYCTTGNMYERDAEKAYQMTPEKYRRVNYYFRENDLLVESGGAQRATPYADIIGLISDGTYYYLFVNQSQAYMMQLKNASRKDEDHFEAVLQEKTGQKWKYKLPKEPFFHAMRKQLREKRGR